MKVFLIKHFDQNLVLSTGAILFVSQVNQHWPNPLIPNEW